MGESNRVEDGGEGMKVLERECRCGWKLMGLI